MSTLLPPLDPAPINNNTPTPETPAPYTSPPQASFPPFYTLQPTASTRASQLASWSALLLAACAASRTFTLSPSSPLFANARLRRRLPAPDARVVLAHMCSAGEAEWVDAAAPGAGWAAGMRGARKAAAAAPPDDADASVYVCWRGMPAWAAELAGWVDATGQRGVVLTLYELLEGDGAAAAGCAWRGMPRGMFARVVGVLVEQGRAVTLGEGEGVGVKIS